jgi:hypothetical protein
MRNTGPRLSQGQDHDGTHRLNSSHHDSEDGNQGEDVMVAGSQQQGPENGPGTEELESPAADTRGSVSGNRAAANTESRYHPRIKNCWQSKSSIRKKRRKQGVNQKNTMKMRSGALYLAADWGGRIKLGISHSESKGHAERIVGKPPRADWGFSMAKSVPVSLGYCTSQESENRLKIFEFLPLLGFSPFLVHPKHEVLVCPSDQSSVFPLYFHDRLTLPSCPRLCGVTTSMVKMMRRD